MSVKLFPHQQEAVDKLSSGKILWGGVGTGKSLTAVAYYVQKEAPRDVYVFTTAKKRDSMDWEMEFLKFGVGDIRTPTTGRLYVDSYNNITKYKNVRGAFMIMDEQRLVGSGAWSKAFIHMTKPEKKNTWILLSATPGDTWMDYVPVFIANGFYKNRTEFIREHVVYSSYTKFPKIEKYINTVKLQRLRNSILIHMPYERHTIRVTQEIEVEYDQKMLDMVIKDRWNPYTIAPIKSLAEFFYTMRKVVYSHPSRLEKVREKLVKHPKLIVFYNFDYELEMLRTLAKDGIAVAEWNGHKHDEIPKADQWLYLVQYTSGSEGWNCVETDATLFYSLTYSYRVFHQAHGRIDRLNTPFTTLRYYVLMADVAIEHAVKKALVNKHNFNEVRFVRKFGSVTLTS